MKLMLIVVLRSASHLHAQQDMGLWSLAMVLPQVVATPVAGFALDYFQTVHVPRCCRVLLCVVACMSCLAPAAVALAASTPQCLLGDFAI